MSFSDSGFNIKRLKVLKKFSACLCEEVNKALPSVPGAAAHLHLKGHTQKRCVLAHLQIVTILTCYIKLYVGNFEQKLHIHTLGASETYFTSCEKGIIPPL